MTSRVGRYGFLRRSASPFFLFLVFLMSPFFPAEGQSEEAAYLDSLLEMADQKQLHENPYWWTLLHYKPSLFGVRSLVDDPDFFLARDGKRDPKAELVATLQGFFQADEDEAHELAPFHLRLPLCGGEREAAVRGYLSFLASQLDDALPIVAVAPLEEPWVDLVVGAPGDQQWWALRASAKGLPYTTDIPYNLEPEFTRRAEDFLQKACDGEVEHFFDAGKPGGKARGKLAIGDGARALLSAATE